jgi:hypothetical protein
MGTVKQLSLRTRILDTIDFLMPRAVLLIYSMVGCGLVVSLTTSLLAQSSEYRYINQRVDDLYKLDIDKRLNAVEAEVREILKAAAATAATAHQADWTDWVTKAGVVTIVLERGFYRAAAHKRKRRAGLPDEDDDGEE